MSSPIFFIVIATIAALGALVSVAYLRHINKVIASQAQQNQDCTNNESCDASQQQETEPEKLVKCPKCETENSDGNLFCSQCGTKLEPSSTPSTSEVVDGLIKENKAALALRKQDQGENAQKPLDLDDAILNTVVGSLQRSTVTGKITVDREFQTDNGAKVNAHFEANVNNNGAANQAKPKTQGPTVTERPIED